MAHAMSGVHRDPPVRTRRIRVTPAGVRALAWWLVVLLACVWGWRDTLRMARHVDGRPDLETCAGLPPLDTLATLVPPHGDVIFVVDEPSAESDRRFFCAQHALAPRVIHGVFLPSLRVEDVTARADALIVHGRDAAAVERALHAVGELAAERDVSIHHTRLLDTLGLVRLGEP